MGHTPRRVQLGRPSLLTGFTWTMTVRLPRGLPSADSVLSSSAPLPPGSVLGPSLRLCPILQPPCKAVVLASGQFWVLTVSGDIPPSTAWGWRLGMLFNTLQRTGQPPGQRLIGPKINSAVAEKPCCEGSSTLGLSQQGILRLFMIKWSSQSHPAVIGKA